MRLRLFEHGRPNGLTRLGWVVWFSIIVVIIWTFERLT